ncbi:MAG TPA: saccharopine dehydrogenase family protein [Candidatus Moranbacteria bacterium]|nr:saccharopine dehydrogenase family protein [Candidatus Moranbacteria bacterium]
MSKVLIIGAGGVGSVVAHKCAQVPEVFSEIVLASRTVSKCQKIADSVLEKIGRKIEVREIDAMNVSDLVKLIQEIKPNIIINVALPGQDLAIMAACAETGVPYLDTANYEPPHRAEFRYEWQWGMNPLFKYKNNQAVLGCGFDPGVTGVFCAYAKKHLFDKIYNIDIVDCNAGNHGHAFATNFDPATNIREVTQVGRYFENGKWVETAPIINKDGSRQDFRQTFDFPGAGPKEMFLIYHEELQSLVDYLPELKRIRFWMTFGEQYLTHLRVLQNVGLTRIDPINFQGKEIIPLDFLSALLPDPASLAKNYTGKTSIGVRFEGEKDGKPKTAFIYNICDHAKCYKEVGSQAISYTTGVPAMIGAKMILTEKWKGSGVMNVENFDPDPFMEDLNKFGLPWEIAQDENVPKI